MGSVEYKATMENKYVHKGSANWIYVHFLVSESSAHIKITDAETITPIDKIISLKIWIYAASMLILLNFLSYPTYYTAVVLVFRTGLISSSWGDVAFLIY